MNIPATVSSPGGNGPEAAVRSRYPLEGTTPMASTLPLPLPLTAEQRLAALEAQMGQILGEFRDFLASRGASRPALTLIRGGRS